MFKEHYRQGISGEHGSEGGFSGRAVEATDFALTVDTFSLAVDQKRHFDVFDLFLKMPHKSRMRFKMIIDTLCPCRVFRKSENSTRAKGIDDHFMIIP